MPTKLTPQQFVANWSNTQLKESASYATHFDDLCELVNHAKPAHFDKTGEVFTYQRGVVKSEGGKEVGNGFADVWFKDHFAIEYKGVAGHHKSLDEAFKQLQQYSGALENPPLLVVCDIEHYEVHANFNGAVSKVYRFTNADIASDKEVSGTKFNAYQILHQLFFDPEGLRPSETISSVTVKAALQFAELSASIHKKNPKLAALQVARFLVKIVFCLFCEDVGLLPKNLFAQIVEQTMGNEAKFARNLRDLFKAMSTGGDMWGKDIPHFNGGLFYANDAEQDVIGLDGVDARTVLSAANLNWADVDPSIFGNLFERALDIEGRRAELGAHYTSREDIETIVKPVLMEPLLREWGDVKLSVSKMAASGKPKASIKKSISKFLDRLAAIKVLDPACGSGNFLYVSLKLLKDLEQQVIALASNFGLDEFEPRVNPAQLYGIEKDDFAHELASIVVWIGYLQWKMKNGYEPAGEQPILKPLNNIQHMDAIIDPASFGNSKGLLREPDWPVADVIVGNPPFLGGNRVRQELGDEYIEALFKLYGGRIPALSDLCCYWFEKARAMIADGKVKRVGLLATQSIRGGANREVLKRIKETGDIFWAQSDRDWLQDGVEVHVSMVGFDNGTEKMRMLDDDKASTINADLTASVDFTQISRLNENANICFRSDEKGGPFDIDGATARAMLAAPNNPNGRPNSDVVRPFYNARDILQKWQDVWIIDFGSGISQTQAALYEMPFEYVKKVVKPVRDQSRNERERKYWWLHRRPAPDMREAVKKLERFIVTPAHSKYRLFIWLESKVIPDHASYIFARDDDYCFGILQSKVHEVWALQQGTALEDRPRYTPTTTFETFPFPWPPSKEPKSDPRVKAIAQAAKELNELRDNWLNPYKDEPQALHADLKKRTLTNLYNEHPTWLQNAHRKLDEAVLDAYGWSHDISDEEILSKLLTLNLERAGK
jgi:type II restriction/modification system DNA methylase subunit YeeA